MAKLQPRELASGSPSATAARRREPASPEYHEKTVKPHPSPASPRKVPHFALPTQASLALFARSGSSSSSSSQHITEARTRTPRGGRAGDTVEHASPQGAGGKPHEDMRRNGRKSLSRQDTQLVGAQETIGNLREEMRLMQSDIKRKEDALLDTTRELEDLKQRNMLLNTTVAAHRQEIRELRAEKTFLESLSLHSQSMDEIGRSAKREGSAHAAAGHARRNQNTTRLKQENIFLLAAIKRYDSAVMSLREVISVMAAQTIKSGEGKTILEEPAQLKLKQVLDSLMRVKDDQVQSSRYI
jgi:hypothetical protein